MKSSMIIFLLVFLSGTSQFAISQEIDRERMQRELKVASAILNSLFEPDQEFLVSRRDDRRQAQYLSGYGVMMTLPAHASVSVAPNIQFMPTTNARSFSGTVPQQGSQIRIGRSLLDSTRMNTLRTGKPLDRDSVEQARTLRSKELVVEYFLDYAHLITQLGPEDRIKIVEERSPFISGGRFVPQFQASNVTGRKQRFAAEVVFGDLIAYQNRQITREEMRSKIRFAGGDQSSEQDLELLANIFDRLYRPDLSETFYYTGYAFYDRIPDFGVIYHLNMLTRPDESMYSFIMRDRMGSAGSQEPDSEKLKEEYPQFIEELKGNMLTYGRTLKSLGEDEKLVFSIRFAGYPRAELPELVHLTVDVRDLLDLNAGKLTMEQALDRIQVDE
ncbi:MAG: hypothetical protein JJU34_10585 [Lunatimonas sp.]|uniref:hypothetical protein n=1 Tax=Lunatimonas sp. TaxID=2060141 RepID=UPI00263ABB33|nr:hypothetical protein [Lunatimonas sp.]MCC5937720.1 hypothetical protein [Lunatimonas sp.]